MSIFSFIAIWLAFAVPSPLKTIGIVVDTKGVWCDEAHLQCDPQKFAGLWRLYAVQEDSKLIRVGAVTGHEYIVIRSRSGALEKYDCASSREAGCKVSLDLTRLSPANPEKTHENSFLDDVMDLASTRPAVYDRLSQSLSTTRSPGGQQLNDGVAKLVGTSLDIKTVFESSAAGEYLLELCPEDDNTNPVCPSEPKPVKYSWNPKQPAEFPANGIHEGFYRLYFCEENSGTAVRTSRFAELLVSGQSRADELADNFRRVRDATAKWDSTDPTAPALRRVYLHSLVQH
jgi:hypothetical protein